MNLSIPQLAAHFEKLYGDELWFVPTKTTTGTYADSWTSMMFKSFLRGYDLGAK